MSDRSELDIERQRAAKNQSLFREVNERIEDLAPSPARGAAQPRRAAAARRLIGAPAARTCSRRRDEPLLRRGRQPSGSRADRLGRVDRGTPHPPISSSHSQLRRDRHRQPRATTRPITRPADGSGRPPPAAGTDSRSTGVGGDRPHDRRSRRRRALCQRPDDHSPSPRAPATISSIPSGACCSTSCEFTEESQMSLAGGDVASDACFPRSSAR